MSFKNGVLESSRADFGGPRPRFWSLRASILKPQGSFFFWGGNILDAADSQLCYSSLCPTTSWRNAVGKLKLHIYLLSGTMISYDFLEWPLQTSSHMSKKGRRYVCSARNLIEIIAAMRSTSGKFFLATRLQKKWFQKVFRANRGR